VKNCIYKSFILCISLFLTINKVYALKKNEEGFCNLSAEVLANPDLVIQDALENTIQSSSKNCNDIYLSKREETNGIGFPKNGYKIKNAGWGIYRDYKIKAYKPGPDLEGHETRIYDVEMIYVAMTRDGPTVPICEYSIVPIRLVKTPWGWRFKNKYAFGSNLKVEIQQWEEIEKILPNDPPEVVIAKNNIRNKEVNQLMKFSKQCELKLN